MSSLTPEQIAFLLAPIHPSRVKTDPKGFAHLEAWDVRRHLIRAFGHGGWSTELQEVTLVSEREKNGRWTVLYRATVVLTVRAADGAEIARYHGVAIGEAVNQPSLGSAHDLALKSADSGALKRAAVNWGDSMGLSLYRDGSMEPVVNRTLTAATEQAQQSPVRPAPEPQQSAPEPVQSTIELPHDQLTQLAYGALSAAAQTRDAEELRGLYRKAAEQGLLGVTVTVPSAGDMPLAHVFSFRAEQLAGTAVKAA